MPKGNPGVERKQFCVNGHDTHICGRYKHNFSCMLCRKAIAKKYRLSHLSKIKQINLKSDLMRKYGLTIEQWQEMFSKQNGCCKICGKHQSQFKSTLCVDHNHITGEVRGLLCPSCNHLLVALENKDFCAKATLYLQGLL